ncbi:hypothetical protein ACO1NJ_13835, partial [Staphylococcus aureus]
AQRLLEAAIPYHPVLRGFGCPLEMALAIRRAPKSKGRWIDMVVGAVLFEHQHAPNGVWSSALMVAFYPGLVTLLERLLSSVHDEDDRRALAIAA